MEFFSTSQLNMKSTTVRLTKIASNTCCKGKAIQKKPESALNRIIVASSIHGHCLFEAAATALLQHPPLEKNDALNYKRKNMVKHLRKKAVPPHSLLRH